MSIVKYLLPVSVRQRLRATLRRRALDRALGALREAARAGEVPRRVLDDLVRAWDNPWSAMPEYLEAVVHFARAADGPILECGSGLTTLIMAAVVGDRGGRIWCLEHSSEWAERTRTALAEHGLSGVEVCVAPLRDYGTYGWYDPPLARMPDDFRLVVCDGPPGDTREGRYGLLPTMGARLGGCRVILLDDAARTSERQVLQRWAAELGCGFEIRGTEKPFGVIVR